MDGINKIQDKLTSFRRKYYLNLAVRGLILTLSLLLFYYLIVSLVEYNLWLSGWARLIIFASFFLLTIFCLYRFLREPITWWLYRRGLGQQESAKLIGAHFPDVSDRLLNLIQLTLIKDNAPLLEAGILQKSRQFDNLQFENAIDLSENKRYLKYFMVPLVLIVLILVFNRGIFTQSTRRIVSFNQEFSPVAPFKFVVQNKELSAFFNEDYTLHIKMEGDAFPEAVYLLSGGQKLKLERVNPGEFQFIFEKVQREIPFQLEGSGFFSTPYTLQLVNRPELTRLKMRLDFPSYLGRKSEELINTGNADVPEGTKIIWQINTSNATEAFAGFASAKELSTLQSIDNQQFTFSKGFHSPDQYWIELKNEHSRNRDKISYTIQVAKDQYPEIKVDHLKDSVLYKNIFLGGNISDDYGLTALTLHYEIVANGKMQSKKINIPLSGNLPQQSFFYQWRVDSIKLRPGEKINYYMEVWDNDGVNGRKSTKSATYVFALPGEEEMKSDILKSQSSAKSQMDKSLKKAKDLRETIDEAQQKLKGKQILDWQDKKMLEDLVEQKKSLDQMINELQKQNEQLEQKKDSFSEQDEKIREKAEQIQKLMNELLDPETKKLFEELEKLLKENSDINQMQKMLDKLNRNEVNLEKELERTLELFKQMQFDYKLDQVISDLHKQEVKQEKLLEQTEELTGDKKDPDNQNKAEGAPDDQKGDKKDKQDKDGKDGGADKEKNTPEQKESSDSQELREKQDQLSKEMEQFEKDLHDLDKMAKDLDKDINPPSDEEIKETKDAQQESKESLSKGNPKKSIAPQKKSVQQMKDMAKQLEDMEESMGMEVDMQNLETLRQILHGLIKLSFDQESLMKEFNQIQQTDPKYIQLSQNQLKIKDDSRILEDSLLSLSKRDAFMNSIVTKEVGELNAHLDKSAENVRERRKPNASSEIQLSMTSINNLALMLNDHFDMMMDMMKNAVPMPGKKKGKGKPQSPSLSELQKQLNQKIEGLKNGPKSGRQYSEELAKVAAEQERIRRALQEMQDKLKKEGGKIPGGDLPGKMEQTEMDLVNKQITEQTIKRQKEIETRLLEAERSMREQDMDEERKGESAKDYDKEIPKAFEEYLRLKEKEVELLKSMPPKFYPYYKKEVNEYFKRIRNQH